MDNKFLDEHPLITSITTIGVIDLILTLLGFDKNQLLVVTFFTSLIIMFIYFDKRIEKLEKSKEGEIKLIKKAYHS